jgi:tRNA(Ile)-lysidine synthase
MRRRVVRAAARRLGARLSFDDTARLLALGGLLGDSGGKGAGRAVATLHLPGQLRAERTARELRLYRVERP